MRPVPVLMYHHINPHKGDMVTVTPEVFEGQMEYLYTSGYKTLKLDELLSFMTGQQQLKGKAVVVTFDDGWLDNYIYAFPVLKKYGIHATVFAVTDWLNRASERIYPIPSTVPGHKESKELIRKGEAYKVMLTWDFVREMQKSGLVDFYSHTSSHAKCSSLSARELIEELGGAKTVLEEQTGQTCPYLCWPYGKYSSLAVDIAKEAGYKALFTTKQGVVKLCSDPFAIERIVVKNNITWFKKRMVTYSNPVLAEIYLFMKKK